MIWTTRSIRRTIFAVVFATIFTMIIALSCAKQPTEDEMPQTPSSMTATTDNLTPYKLPSLPLNKRLIGTWTADDDAELIFYLNGMGYFSRSDDYLGIIFFNTYKIWVYSCEENILTLAIRSYYDNDDNDDEYYNYDESAQSFIETYTLDWSSDDRFIATDKNGTARTFQRQAPPTAEMLTGYWLHNSGMYGFEAWNFSPDGKGWLYGYGWTDAGKWLFGYSEITGWYITEDYKLVVYFGEITRPAHNEYPQEMATGGHKIIAPIYYRASDEFLMFEPYGAAEPVYYLRVKDITISDDLLTAYVKYLDGDYYGSDPQETIPIFTNERWG